MRRSTPRAAQVSPLVPDDELEFRASRAGGPGGQHVNRSATRVEVRWNVRTSRLLTDAQRALLIERLGKRLDRDGSLRVVASALRSQWQNRAEATRRLRELVERALRPPRLRRATTVPAAERERRLEDKRRRGAVKRERGKVWDDE